MSTRSRAAAGLRARSAAPSEPGRHRLVGAGDHRRDVHVVAPRPLDLLGVAAALLRRLRPRIVIRALSAGIGAVEDERARALRVRRGEQRTHRAAFRIAEERSFLAPRRVHDGTHVVHPRFEIGEPDCAIGQARPALVEADQPRERREALDEARHLRVLEVDLQVREEPVHQYEVERPVARHLVGDVRLAAARVPDRPRHPASSREAEAVDRVVVRRARPPA